MAEIRLQTPDPFNFRKPDDWPRWKRRFQQFREASGLSEATATKQISTFLYCLGEEAETVLSSTNATEDDRKDYDRVLAKFDAFFKVRRNIISERARFNRRNQQSGETSEEFIMALHSLAENCDYGNMTDEMIRDRLVVGIRDTALSEKLQMDPTLTLATAEKTVRQREAVHEQQRSLKEADSRQIDAVPYERNHFAKKGNYERRTTTAKTTSTQDGGKCGRCGRERHSRDKCPAKDAKCLSCQKVGHYSAVCRTRNVSTLLSGDTDDVDTMSAVERNAWYAAITIDDKEVTFKLDTGAEVTAVSQETWQTLNRPTLQPSNRQLLGPARQSLEVMGCFHANLTHKEKKASQQVYVVSNLSTNLLGLPAISALHLATRVDTMDTSPTMAEKIKNKFPNVFKGLGNLGGEYEIKLEQNAKPFSLFAPRHVPIPLRQKVSEELVKMEQAGVISKVSEPTPWCAGMVVVPKKSGDVRICVDLKPLNKSVLREVHPLPKVDDTLAQLSGARVFSKLDANSEFWQIPLSQSSRLLTTFIAHTGRYCFNKLPFGISSAPEHFQRRMGEILAGLSGVQCLMDDILIYGKDQTEHDTRLEAVLQRIESAGVTLNLQNVSSTKKASHS